MTDISEQPVLVNLQANVAQQIPTLGQNGKGVQLINQNGFALSLCSDENFTVPVVLDVGVSMPWTTGTTVWVLSPEVGQLLVLSNPYNYYNPNVAVTPAHADILLGPVLSTAGTSVLTVPLTQGIRTLVIGAESTGGGVAPLAGGLVQVTGVQSQFIYCLKPFYLGSTYYPGFSADLAYLMVVPIASSVDTEIQIFIVGPGSAGEYSFNVYGDTDLYDESIFYTGTPTATSSNTASTLVNGPCRLLSAEVFSTSTAAAAIKLGSGTLIETSGAADQPVAISLPDDTIVPAGTLITLAGTNPFGAVSTAYP